MVAHLLYARVGLTERENLPFPTRTSSLRPALFTKLLLVLGIIICAADWVLRTRRTTLVAPPAHRIGCARRPTLTCWPALSIFQLFANLANLNTLLAACRG